jgi:hypothetical protein
MVILWGILVGLLGLVVLARPWGRIGESPSDWFFVSTAALFGFVPLFASLIAIRNPRRAGVLFLFSTPFSLAAFCLADIDRLRYGMVVWYDLVSYSFLATFLAFLVAGLFWLGTHRFNWPPVSSRPRPASLRRKIARLSLTGILLFMLVLIGVVILAALAPPLPGDCGEGAPISRRRYPGHAVFVARVVAAVGPCEKFSGRRMCGGAVAVVQQRFWGIHSRLVLLTQGFFEDGEDYFIDGTHADGLLTRFLPIIGFGPCSRTARLKDAEVDLRVLRDGPPHSGVRIIGRVSRHYGKEVVPGRDVVITGPAGNLTVTTDQQGVYDVTGLPPGHYDVRAETRSEKVGRAACRWTRNSELKSGDVAGCTLFVE